MYVCMYVCMYVYICIYTLNSCVIYLNKIKLIDATMKLPSTSDR